MEVGSLSLAAEGLNIFLTENVALNLGANFLGVSECNVLYGKPYILADLMSWVWCAAFVCHSFVLVCGSERSCHCLSPDPATQM